MRQLILAGILILGLGAILLLPGGGLTTVIAGAQKRPLSRA